MYVYEYCKIGADKKKKREKKVENRSLEMDLGNREKICNWQLVAGLALEEVR